MQIIEYKLDRYVYTGSSLERVKGLGQGETIATLKELVNSDNLALGTLLQVLNKFNFYCHLSANVKPRTKLSHKFANILVSCRQSVEKV